MRCWAGDLEGDVGVAAYTARHLFGEAAEDATDDEVADTHSDAACDQKGAAAGTVDEEEHYRGETK